MYRASASSASRTFGSASRRENSFTAAAACVRNSSSGSSERETPMRWKRSGSAPSAARL
jgi:hypothetical protein